MSKLISSICAFAIAFVALFTTPAHAIETVDQPEKVVPVEGCASQKPVTVYITKEELMTHATGIGAGITVTSWVKKELAAKIAAPTVKVTVAFTFIAYAAGLVGYKGVAFQGVKGFQNTPYGCQPYGSFNSFYFYK